MSELGRIQHCRVTVLWVSSDTELLLFRVSRAAGLCEIEVQHFKLCYLRKLSTAELLYYRMSIVINDYTVECPGL